MPTYRYLSEDVMSAAITESRENLLWSQKTLTIFNFLHGGTIVAVVNHDDDQEFEYSRRMR